MDLISVVVPVYNVAAYLDRCVESIAKQTYSHLEIILIDDGSTDGSSQFCDLWAEKDSRVTVIHQNNMGQAQARNMGIQKFRGNYLLFVDSDDFLPCDAVQVLYDRIILDKSDLAIGNGVNVNEAGEIIGDLYTMVEDAQWLQQEINNRFHEIPCMVWGKLYKRAVIQNAQFPLISSGEDLWILYDIVSKCKLVSLCNKTTYFYTQRMSSIVHTLNDKKLFDSTSAAVYVCKKLAEANYWKTAKRFFSMALFRAAEMKKPEMARKLIADTFPWYIQLWLLEGNFHIVIRWLALNNPMLHQMIKRRHGSE